MESEDAVRGQFRRRRGTLCANDEVSLDTVGGRLQRPRPYGVPLVDVLLPYCVCTGVRPEAKSAAEDIRGGLVGEHAVEEELPYVG